LEAAFGGLNRLRRVHYLAALFMGASVLGHLYFAVSSGGEKLKSIFTGYKALGKK
jgi:thiosulfate reductase cytochrome b subunit